jgi:hypothetical protein
VQSLARFGAAEPESSTSEIQARGVRYIRSESSLPNGMEAFEIAEALVSYADFSHGIPRCVFLF